MRTITLENGKKVEISEESYQNLSKATQYTRWRPIQNNRYYFLNARGNISDSLWNNIDSDKARWAIGNVYSTEEKAEEAAHAMKMRQKILDRIAELNEGWEPSWEDGIEKWMLIYVAEDREYQVDFFYHSKHLPNKYYFKSKEVGDRLIKEFGDDIKYLFI